jgi:hypothetical protein
MIEPERMRVLGIALLLLAGGALSRPLAAQQIGRMQVHATVVDLSESRRVLGDLTSLARRPDGDRVLANRLVFRASLVTEVHRPAGQSQLEPERRERRLLVFYL